MPRQFVHTQTGDESRRRAKPTVAIAQAREQSRVRKRVAPNSGPGRRARQLVDAMSEVILCVGAGEAFFEPQLCIPMDAGNTWFGQKAQYHKCEAPRE
eukprot:6208451-Pleurochrysis_carterae.AAC.2